MNRITLLFLVLFAALTSCKKEYTCSCQSTYVTTAYTQYGTFHPQSVTTTNFTNTWKIKEAAAKSNCDNNEKLSVNSYGSGESQRTATETVACELY